MSFFFRYCSFAFSSLSLIILVHFKFEQVSEVTIIYNSNTGEKMRKKINHRPEYRFIYVFLIPCSGRCDVLFWYFRLISSDEFFDFHFIILWKESVKFLRRLGIFKGFIQKNKSQWIHPGLMRVCVWIYRFDSVSLIYNNTLYLSCVKSEQILVGFFQINNERNLHQPFRMKQQDKFKMNQDRMKTKHKVHV